ncbi:MAG TPA: pyridoxal phosphate-dependent aminotransferase, partial [Gammaproteobacteria bacterium]|nr:pyridoxal phosphate-dependent aminotransferase [Gammaproteobacteria bacterium]
QPHVDPNPIVRRRLREENEKPGYPQTLGEPDTLAAGVRLLKNYFPQVAFETDELMVTVGATGALCSVFAALVEKPEDKILTFGAFFATYEGQVEQWNGNIEVIPAEKNPFRPTEEEFRATLEKYPGTKALLLNYPNNPSGVSLRREDAQMIARVLSEEKYQHIQIIIDDVYRDFDHLEHVTLLDVAPELKDRCAVVLSASKGLYGDPGVRAGLLAGSKDLIKACTPTQITTVASATSQAQRVMYHAATEYLENADQGKTSAWLMNTKNEYKKNLAVASQAFKEAGFKIPIEPEGAFFLIVDASSLRGKMDPENNKVMQNDADIAEYFMTAAGVSVVPGQGFRFAPEKCYLRISCAQPEANLRLAAQRMGAAAKLLQYPIAKPKL